MHDPHSDAAFLDGRDGVAAQRAMLTAYLWIVASLATAILILSVAWIVAARSEREAGRMIISAQRGTGYAAVVVDGLAALHARPRP